jgi:hypothetical protein
MTLNLSGRHLFGLLTSGVAVQDRLGVVRLTCVAE